MDSNKIIISSLITLVLIGFLVCILIVDIPLLGVSSIKTVNLKHFEVVAKEAELVNQQNAYNESLKRLEDAKKNYSTEKQKYDSISEETINIIKEANTVDNYSLEYMWIKLGNYAKRNNLAILMVEPGGTSTPTTTTTESEKKEDKSVVEDTNKETTTNTRPQGTSNALQIEIIGSYINLSDFIFEVENDSELKFKLDNIAMTYVEGTTVKAIFDVKNIKINK